MRETHERTFRAMQWAGVAILGILMGYCTFGCTSPTAASIPYTHNQELIVGYTACYAGDMHIDVEFFTEERLTKMDWLCQKSCEMSPVAGLALLPARKVAYWWPWVEEAQPSSLKWVAAHEVSHVLMMSYDEAEVQARAFLVYGECNE